MAIFPDVRQREVDASEAQYLCQEWESHVGAFGIRSPSWKHCAIASARVTSVGHSGRGAEGAKPT